MVHGKHAHITNRAMVGPCRLHFLTFLTIPVPNTLKLIDGLCAVFHQAFHIFLEVGKAIILLLSRFIFDGNFNSFTMLTFLMLISLFLDS